MIKEFIENITIFTFSLSLVAFLMSIWNFIKQHFSSDVIVYPIEKDKTFYLVIENVGNAKALIDSLKLNTTRHYQDNYESHLSVMPVFRGRHSMMIPSKASYKFIVGDTYEPEKVIDSLPCLELEIKFRRLKYFNVTRKHKCDFNIFLKPGFVYERTKKYSHTYDSSSK